MDSVGIRELKTNASEIVRRVRENKETIAITYRGEVVAHLSPANEAINGDAENLDAYWAALDHLIADIARQTPGPVNAVDVMQDMRREFS